MIDRILKVLVEEELNQFLTRHRVESPTPQAKLGLPSLSMNKASSITEEIIVASLINLEQERVHMNTSLSGGAAVRNEVPLIINAYVLFAANHRNYLKALEQLSNTLAFFQSKAVFTRLNTPNLPSTSEKVTVELFSLDLQNLGSFWASIGNDIPPAALYKIRSISITEDMIPGESPDITSIEQNS